MRRGVLGGLALALMATSALAGPDLKVTLKPNDKGVLATFVLPKAVDRFVFEEKVDDVRDDAWRPPTDMSLNVGVLKRFDGRKFSTFTIQLTPDSAPRDRRYPSLTRIGDGWQVYGPYFAGEKNPASSAAVVAPRGWTVLPTKPAKRVSLDRYAYVGPAAYVTNGAATLVVAPNIAKGLRGQIVQASEGVTAYYTRRLGVPLTPKPTLLATRVPEFDQGWQGDVVPGGAMMSLRFFGPAKGEMESNSALTGFVAHEFFHFWNGGLYRSRDGENDAWLHEGAAEYAALLASRELGAREEAAVGKALAERLTGCAAALKDKGLANDPPKKGKAVYDCGVAVQWAADLKVRAASGGKRDVLDAWKDVFAYAKAGDHRYDAKGFLAAGGMTETADDPLRLLMRPGEPDRWDRLTVALGRLGARLERSRSNDGDRAAAMFALLGPICKGDHGFSAQPGDDFITLAIGERCEGIKGDLKVDQIAGRDAAKDGSGAFDAVATLCASGSGDVPLGYQGKVVGTLPCRKLPAPPLAWTVSKWR